MKTDHLRRSDKDIKDVNKAYRVLEKKFYKYIKLSMQKYQKEPEAKVT